MRLTNLLNLKHNNFFGIDVGFSSVKVVQMRKGKHGYDVVAAGWEKIAEIDNTTSQSQNANTASAIRRCVRNCGIKSNLAVCSVEGPEVSVRRFSFPTLTHEEMKNAVLFEAGQVFPFELKHSTVDYERMNPESWSSDHDQDVMVPEGQDIQGVMVAATNRLIQERRQMLKSISLKCALMDVDSLALLNCLTECEKPSSNRSIACVHVGSFNTHIIVLPTGRLPHLRDLPYAARDVIDQLASDHNVPVSVMEKILFTHQGAHRSEADITSSLQKSCKRLVSGLTETLRYYSTQEKIPPVERIYICGDLALVDGFVDMLGSMLSEEVVVWNPFTSLNCNSITYGQDIIDQYGPALAVAAGLAMRTYPDDPN